jgi:hypothetical protein
MAQQAVLNAQQAQAGQAGQAGQARPSGPPGQVPLAPNQPAPGNRALIIPPTRTGTQGPGTQSSP